MRQGVFNVYSGETQEAISLTILNSAVMIFVADGFLQKASIGIMGDVFVDILKGMWKAITMIVFIIALTKVMGCIGMTSVIEIPGQI